MFDGLSRCEQASVEGRRALIFLHDLGTLLGDTHNRRAGFTLRLLFDDRENLLEAIDLSLSLRMMLLKGGFQLLVLSRLRHLRQSRQNLLLREIDVLQGVVKQVIEIFRFFGQLDPPMELSEWSPADQRSPGQLLR